jgi:hypothetical protein
VSFSYHSLTGFYGPEILGAYCPSLSERRLRVRLQVVVAFGQPASRISVINKPFGPHWIYLSFLPTIRDHSLASRPHNFLITMSDFIKRERVRVLSRRNILHIMIVLNYLLILY